jgi:hypothetical protein
MADLGFSVEASAPSNDYDVLPDGWYSARITQADVRETRAGTGSYISVRYDVTGPTHEGRVVWGNLNLSNPNPRAEQIGREQLSQLIAAIGLAKITDSDELIGGELEIKVRIKTDDYGTKNEVKAWKAREGSSAPKPPSATPAAPAAPAAPAKAPWAK